MDLLRKTATGGTELHLHALGRADVQRGTSGAIGQQLEAVHVNAEHIAIHGQVALFRHLRFVGLLASEVLQCGLDSLRLRFQIETLQLHLGVGVVRDEGDLWADHRRPLPTFVKLVCLDHNEAPAISRILDHPNLRFRLQCVGEGTRDRILAGHCESELGTLISERQLHLGRILLARAFGRRGEDVKRFGRLNKGVARGKACKPLPSVLVNRRQNPCSRLLAGSCLA
mmetsp:Transcript_93699/g.201059  ORF Transcript_93699/g.201059 Transcript_93699/m.201059 type:complete len:227 (+) Transcript_93699:742-1422(+)